LIRDVFEVDVSCVDRCGPGSRITLRAKGAVLASLNYVYRGRM
jgi:hypothetical protein